MAPFASRFHLTHFCMIGLALILGAPPAHAQGTSGKGTIQGQLGFPAEYIPSDMIICAQNIASKAQQCTTAKGRDNYRLSVPAGRYHVYATLPKGRKPASDLKSGYRAYYSQHVTCGHNVACPSHAPIPVTVKAGQTVRGINPTDWYNR